MLSQPRRPAAALALLLLACIAALAQGGAAPSNPSTIYVVQTHAGVKCEPTWPALWIVRTGPQAGPNYCSAHNTLTPVSPPVTPGGSPTQVQVNIGGVLAGDAGMTYDPVTDTLTVGALVTTGGGYVNFPTQSPSTTTGDFWRTTTSFLYFDGTAARTIATTESAQILKNKEITNPAITTQPLTDGATVNWNADLGNVATWTIGGNRTIAAPTNLKVGSSYALRITQDGTGSRTVTWNAAFKWPGATAPMLTTTAGRTDLVTCISFDGATLLCNALLDVR